MLTPLQGNDFLREIWGSRPFISAGGYNHELAVDVAEKTGNLIAFGRHFIANVRYNFRHPERRKTFY